MIRLFGAKNTFEIINNNGIKILHPLFAEITKVDNGDYYIEIEDLLDNLEYYQKGMILAVDTPWGVQGFRCDNPIIENNRISLKAWHLFYDSENYIINNASAVNKNCNDAIIHYSDNTDTKHNFSVSSDIVELKTTSMVRKSLFDAFTELLNVYGGHWVRNNFDVDIKSSIGQDRGVVLAYNKNITDIKVEENWDNVCTKILPFVKDGDNEITLDDIYLETSEKLYDIPYTKVLEFKFEAKDGESAPTSTSKWKEWLHNEAFKYLEANKVPLVNYSVSTNIDNVSDVGDRIFIKHPKISESLIKTWVISIKYDAIRGKYTAIEFGNFRKEFKSLVSDVTSTVGVDIIVKNNDSTALLMAELNKATSKINSVLSESNVIYNGNEIIILDKLPKESAMNCIKINSAGIGFSSSGIKGTFNSAWTIDGTLDMQAVNLINLTASLIKGGTLKLGATNNSSGTFELYDNSNRLIALMDKEGLTVYAQNGDYVKLNAEVGFAGFNKSGAKIYWADGDVFRMRNAEVENEIKIAGKIKIVPVSTNDNVGVGFVAIS